MSDIEPGDIVQVDPASEMGKEWGPQLCVVSELKPWGVQAYFIHASSRGNFGPAYVRLQKTDFVRVGRAEWAALRGEP